MPAHQFQGFVDTVDSQNGIIAGWAVNLHEPSRVVLLHVLVDGQEVMQVLCDLKREDVRQILRIPSNKLGFRFRLPPEACDGAQHGISIRFDDRTALLFPDEDQPDRAHETLTFSRPPQTEYQSCVDGMFSKGCCGAGSFPAIIRGLTGPAMLSCLSGWMVCRSGLSGPTATGAMLSSS